MKKTYKDKPQPNEVLVATQYNKPLATKAKTLATDTGTKANKVGQNPLGKQTTYSHKTTKATVQAISASHMSDDSE